MQRGISLFVLDGMSAFVSGHPDGGQRCPMVVGRREHQALARRIVMITAIELAQGNQAKAARWLNVSRQTMRDKLTHFGLRTPLSNGSVKSATP